MSNALQERKRQTMVEYFQQEVTKALATMPDFINLSEARRLTLNMVVAAQDAVEKTIDAARKDPKKKPFTFTPKNIPDFLTQVIMHVTAGLDAANDEVYVYPYGDKMAVKPSYRGFIKMAKEHALGDPIEDILPFVVREGESFFVKYGPQTDEWEYDSITFNGKPPIGYITVIVYKNGRSRVMEHTLEDVEKRRQANPAGGSPAWKNWPVEMAIAKVLRRHARTVNIRLKPEVSAVAELVGFEEVRDLPLIELPDLEFEALPDPAATKAKPAAKKKTEKAEKVDLEGLTPPEPAPAKKAVKGKEEELPPPPEPPEDDGEDTPLPF